MFLVSTGIGSVFVCAFRKDLAHFECVRALFVFMCNCAHLGRIWLTLYLLFVCAFRKDLAHFVFMCALFVFVYAFRKDFDHSVFVCVFRTDLAHFGFACAPFVFVCAFRKDLVHFGAEASIIPLCQT